MPGIEAKNGLYVNSPSYIRHWFVSNWKSYCYQFHNIIILLLFFSTKHQFIVCYFVVKTVSTIANSQATSTVKHIACYIRGFWNIVAEEINEFLQNQSLLPELECGFCRGFSRASCAVTKLIITCSRCLFQSVNLVSFRLLLIIHYSSLDASAVEFLAS